MAKIKFNLGTEARAIARERIGNPGNTKVRQDKRRKKARHKKKEDEHGYANA